MNYEVLGEYGIRNLKFKAKCDDYIFIKDNILRIGIGAVGVLVFCFLKISILSSTNK